MSGNCNLIIDDAVVSDTGCWQDAGPCHPVREPVLTRCPVRYLSEPGVSRSIKKGIILTPG